jgi:hypothetical protein
MIYRTGDSVALGDKVRLDGCGDGVVVCIIEDCGYSDAYPQSDWSYLQSGALIEFLTCGLVHVVTFDQYIVLVSRAAVQL